MIYRKHSNDVARQVETPGWSIILSCDKFTLSHEMPTYHYIFMFKIEHSLGIYGISVLYNISSDEK